MFENRRLIARGTGENLYLPKEVGYFGLWVAALVLSAFFPEAKSQLLLFALILGIKWIASGNSRNVNIVIMERRRFAESVLERKITIVTSLI